MSVGGPLSASSWMLETYIGTPRTLSASIGRYVNVGATLSAKFVFYIADFTRVLHTIVLNPTAI